MAGSYFICDEEGTNVAVFKPEDEEPLAVNNPKGGGSSADMCGSGLRRGIKPGEGAVREVAAFLLDHQHFSGVPPTAMVTCLQRRPSADISGAISLEEAKLGSLQQFVKSDGDCEERGSSIFAVKEVQLHSCPINCTAPWQMQFLLDYLLGFLPADVIEHSSV